MTIEKTDTVMIAKLRKFVKIRNSSGLNSNLQFSFDLEEAGLAMKDLPEVIKVTENHYVWELPCGRLTEIFGAMQFQEKGEYVS